MQGQSSVLWKVSFKAVGLNTIDRYSSLLILGNEPEVAINKAKQVLKKDGGIGVEITSVVREGTIDAF